MCSELKEIKKQSELIYSGKIIKVFRDIAVLPNGNEGTREYIRHMGAVCVVPLTDDGRVIVEKQFRYPLNEVLTEIPAGKLDSKEENPEAAAARELKEETGFSAGRFIPMGDFYPTCAYSDEVIHIFLAEELTAGARQLDDDEFLKVESVPLESLVEDIMCGKIKDGKTQAAVMKAYYYIKNRRTVNK